ncbi:hypothetical protein IWX88_000084 [Frigoribacterium sp. CG_9.8]|nr:hypothetical protein [Frigoribacterium sp. CG_9.8]
MRPVNCRAWFVAAFRLLAAVALQVVHRVDRHRVSADEAVVVVHGVLLGWCVKSLASGYRAFAIGAVVVPHYITGMTLLSFHYI